MKRCLNLMFIGCVMLSLLSACAATAPSARAPGTVFRDCKSGCPDMVVIPKGSFQMGSPAEEVGRSANEGPQHLVTIAQPFAMARYEVTVGEYAAFVKATKRPDPDRCMANVGTAKPGEDEARSWHNPGFPQTDRHPVTCVSFEDAVDYAKWLSDTTGHQYALPSEAQWEYAARAGTTGARYWMDSNPESLCGHANFADRALQDENARRRAAAGDTREQRQMLNNDPAAAQVQCSDGFAFTAPVGSYPANAFGLYDLYGNQLEWTLDCTNANYVGAPSDGSAWLSGDCNARVPRGGSWIGAVSNQRSAYRGRTNSNVRSSTRGFRVVMTW